MSTSTETKNQIQPQGKKIITHLVLQKIIPSLAAENVANCKLEQIKWHVSNQTVKPDYTSPAPAAPLYTSKTPICINCYQRGYLPFAEWFNALVVKKCRLFHDTLNQPNWERQCPCFNEKSENSALIPKKLSPVKIRD